MRWALGLILLSVAACGARTPFPDMQAGETGRVVRVIDGDALVLDTGQSVRLVAIEAPALRPRGRDPEAYAKEAARALEDLALGRQVQLYYPGLTRDRYDRALAHVVTLDGAGEAVWLNMALVEAGAARVRLYSDTAAQGEALLLAEAAAREAGAGLWGKRDYQVRDGGDLAPDARGFRVVSGTVVAVEASGADGCILQLAEGTLQVRVAAGAQEALCRDAEGRAFRLRGWVSDGVLSLDHPLHAEPVE